MNPRCPKCASDQLTMDTNRPRVMCQGCNQVWEWAELADLSRFFVAANPETIANSDERAIHWAILRTMDILFELFTPENYGEIAESIYGPFELAGTKEIFIGQIEDVMAALHKMAAARVRERKESIVASIIHRNDRIM